MPYVAKTLISAVLLCASIWIYSQESNAVPVEANSYSLMGASCEG